MRNLCLVAMIGSLFFSSVANPDSVAVAAENHWPERTLQVAVDGRIKARILVPDSEPAVWVYAEFLQEYLGQIAGEKPAIAKETEAVEGAPISIHVGQTTRVSKYFTDTATWDEDEYVVFAPDSSTLLLAGAREHATEYAVAELLQRYCGVRWLFPGKLGTEIPQNPDLSWRIGQQREKPAYLSRRVSAPPLWGNFRGPTGRNNIQSDLGVWARLHRHRGRIDFSHSLGRRIFEPELLAESHPEIFPIINDKRLIPLGGVGGTAKGGGWQPCFTNPNTLEIGLDVILKALRKMPSDSLTFALGVNDRDGHCTCDACRAMDGERVNYLNYNDRSPSYFAWANAIAEGVAKEFPETKLGFLAYNGVATPPPDMPVHPMLVPYITSDRMKWVDAKARERDIEINKIWHDAVPEVGWYDYTYGEQYSVPRVYFHKMAEYLRYGYANGVRYYVTEAYPASDWHEGPKNSLLLALLWNPNIDVDAFLQDWYEAAVGEEAASLLRDYYGFWENYWEKEVPKTNWFKNSKNLQYFLFRGSGYLTELSMENIAYLRGLVAELLEKTTDSKKERAGFLAEGMRKRLEEASVVVERNEKTVSLKPGPNEKIVLQDSFDAFDNKWSVWTRRNTSAEHDIMAEMDGSKGILRINLTEARGSPVVLMRSFEPIRGKIYRASFRAKCARVDDPVTLSVRFRNTNKKIMFDLGVEAQPQYLSGDVWQDLSIYFRVPANLTSDAETLTVLFNLPQADKGFIYVDSFTLAVSDDVPVD